MNADFGGGRAKTWLTPNGPVEAKIIYDNYSLGLGVVRFPSDLVATVQVTGQTPVDEDYTDYFYTQASIREPGDTGDKPTGRAAKFLQLQQEVIKQDFFTWENMKYLEKPNLAPEEARDYAALRRWAHRFYPGTEASPDDFGYTADGDTRSGGCEGVMPAGSYTVPAVLDRRAEQFGDRVMMSIAGTPVTFAQMRDRSCAAANVLADLGVQRGETVALFTGTCPEWVYFWLGAARIGAITAAVNGASKGDFLLARAAAVHGRPWSSPTTNGIRGSTMSPTVSLR